MCVEVFVVRRELAGFAVALRCPLCCLWGLALRDPRLVALALNNDKLQDEVRMVSCYFLLAPCNGHLISDVNLTTQPSCANSTFLYPYKNLKPRTDASKRLTPSPLNKISLTLSLEPVLSVTTITISAMSLTSTPLSAVAQPVRGS